MQLPSSRLGQFVTNRLIMEELDCDSTVESHLFESLHVGLNDYQKRVFSTIMDAYTRQTGGLFFVYGSGGTGKAYLWRTLIAKVRSQKKNCSFNSIIGHCCSAFAKCKNCRLPFQNIAKTFTKRHVVTSTIGPIWRC